MEAPSTEFRLALESPARRGINYCGCNDLAHFSRDGSAPNTAPSAAEHEVNKGEQGENRGGSAKDGSEPIG